VNVEQVDFVSVPTRDVERAGIGFRVADVEVAVDELRAAGGEVIGIYDSGVCHMRFCKDLDGNTIILHRRYAPRVRES